MDLKKIPPAYTPEKLLDIAFRRASKEARKVQMKNRSLRKKRAEERRVRESADYITSYLSRMEKLGDKIELAGPFHRELLEISIGIDRVHSALERLAWAKTKIAKLEVRSRRNIRMKKGDPVILRKDFYGKTSSILGKIEMDLQFLGRVVQTIRNFPTIKEGFTVVIAGMPNVGKSSLLRQLTSSTPDIKPYPFTTKSILVGYIEEGHRRVQIIDTPGILDRPIEERNTIERQAVLALRELADLILFLFDPTETCGYTRDSQIELYTEIRENFKDVIPVLNKMDLADESIVKSIEDRIGKKAVKCSSKEGQIEDVLSLIATLQRKENNLALPSVHRSPR
jgi:nucleolar GTP-binding protein